MCAKKGEGGGGQAACLLEAASLAALLDLAPITNSLDRRVVVLHPLPHARLVRQQDVMLAIEAHHATQAVELRARRLPDGIDLGKIERQRKLLEQGIDVLHTTALVTSRKAHLQESCGIFTNRAQLHFEVKAAMPHAEQEPTSCDASVVAHARTREKTEGHFSFKVRLHVKDMSCPVFETDERRGQEEEKERQRKEMSDMDR